MRNSIKALILATGMVLALYSICYADLRYKGGADIPVTQGNLPLTGGEMLGPIKGNQLAVLGNMTTNEIHARGTIYGSPAGVSEFVEHDNNLSTVTLGKIWGSIAYGGGVWCALQFNSNVAATSTDGITWTLQTLPASAGWVSIAWNGTVFCAIANGTDVAATSPDGVTWTQQTMSANTSWVDIAWNGTVFCAIASGGNVAATSPTGVTWTTRTLSASDAWQAIAWNGTVFCAIATGGTVASTSPTGVTWTARILPSSQTWYDITAGNGVFCTVATASNVAATSPDGITWTQQTLPATSDWVTITFGGGVFCAIGDNGGGAIGNAATSPDGATWTTRNIAWDAISQPYWYEVASDGGTFVGIGQNAAGDAMTFTGGYPYYQNRALAADVTMTSANQYYDGPSLTLAPGTWLICAHATVSSAGGTANLTAKLWDGTNVATSAENWINTANNAPTTLESVVHITTTATWKISCASSQTTCTIRAAAPNNGAGNNATTISAILISN